MFEDKGPSFHSVVQKEVNVEQMFQCGIVEGDDPVKEVGEP